MIRRFDCFEDDGNGSVSHSKFQNFTFLSYRSEMSVQSSNYSPDATTSSSLSNMLNKFSGIAQKGKNIAEKGKNIAKKGLTASLDTFHSTAQSVGLKDKVGNQLQQYLRNLTF